VSSTDVLLNVATAARLFHAADGTGFADLIIDGHRQTWPLRSKRFQGWLRQQYYERTWDAPSPAALNSALNVLEAQAQFDGPQRKVSLRLAEQEGLIYLDLLPRMGYRCCRGYALNVCRAWPISPSGPQPARAHFDSRAPWKPLIPTTGATRSRTWSTPTRWRRLCARSWPTEHNGREAHRTFCRSALAGLAGQRAHARSCRLRIHPPCSAKCRSGANEYTSHASAPGSEPSAKIRPKHTEKSNALSGAMP